MAKKSSSTDKPYCVGLLIANSVLNEQNRAEGERLLSKAEAREEAGEFAEADRDMARDLLDSVVLSSFDDSQRDDVRRVQALCEARSGRFDATTLRQLRGEVCRAGCLDIGNVSAMTLDVFAEKVTAIESQSVGPTKVKGRRGKKKADYDTIQKEADIVAKWERAKESKTYKGDFAKEIDMTLTDLDKLLDRVSARNRRSDN